MQQQQQDPSNQQQQQQQQQQQSQQPQRKNYHVARRRSPSDLTPLMVEQLALQQQIEMLQAQQQQILAQHQQFSQAGLLPPLVPQPAYMAAATAPFGQFASPPPIPAISSSSGAAPNRQSPTHRRAQSSISGYNHGSGHTRRHSLALSEAKKAAAAAQAKRHESDDVDVGSPPGSTSTSAQVSSPARQEFRPGSSSTFKFPSAPEQPSSTSSLKHGRSQSVQYPSTSRRNQFQFPAKDDQGFHQKTGSRNFEGNWRDQQQQPSSGFVPGHRPRGSYGSISSISHFYGGGPPGASGQPSGQQRKSLFTPYLPQASLPDLLEQGRLVSGILRVNKKNRSDAYVSTDGLLDADIFICGSKDRNRALEGDLVAIELLDVDEVWDSKREKEEKKKRRDQSSFDERSDNTTLSVGNDLRRKGSLKQRPTQKKNDDVEVEGQSLLLSEEEELSDEIKPLYAGHVVAVIERIPGQTFSGTLGLLRPSSQATKEKQVAERREKGEAIDESFVSPKDRPKILWFKPTDKRVPLIAIPTEQAPKDFVDNHESYASKIFVASIKRWPITSLHPFGTLVDQLGEGDSKDVQTEAILRDNNYSSEAFGESVIKNVSELDTFSEAVAANEQRTDFTGEMVIGLTGNSYCESAIHFKSLEDRRMELGIHISDVSYFVKENSALDREARKRGSSVVLPQKSLDLFPVEFNHLASFVKDKVSPTLSVVFEIDSAWDIVDTNISVGYVKPAQILTFAEIGSALEMLSNNQKASITTSHPTKTGQDYVVLMEKISRSFRKDRLSLGTDRQTPILSLLDFVEDDKVDVSGTLYDSSPVQHMIDEVIVKVNCAVAHKVYSQLSSLALLRRHPEPVLSKLETFSSLVTGMDLSIDTSSAVGLQRSLFGIESDDQRAALETLLFKALGKAKYFVAGKVDSYNYSHYWLNVSLYTHFNAPLRRYADIIVHRQLRSVLLGTPYVEDLNSLATTAEFCNFKKDSAKNAQEQAIHLELCQKISSYSHNAGNIILRNAIVIQVYESAFDVLIPEFGIEKRVHGDQLPLVKAEYNKKSRVLDLFWEKGVDSAAYVPDDEKKKKSYDSDSLNCSLRKLNISSDEMADLTHELVTREEDGCYIQEIRALQHLPVLIRAELGKGIPCITVRTINPFA